VAVDLSISEIVDAPNWIVSASLPESISQSRKGPSAWLAPGSRST
jgi:acetamidase/formamidase